MKVNDAQKPEDFKGYHSKSEMRRMEAQKPEAPNELIDERPETEKLKSSRDYFFDKWQATLEQLEAAQKEIAALKGGLDAALKVQNDITDAAVAKLTHAQRKLQAERAKVESLLKENDVLRAGSPAFQRAAELQAKVSELEADVAILKKEKSSLMRSLAKFTGNT